MKAQEHSTIDLIVSGFKLAASFKPKLQQRYLQSCCFKPVTLTEPKGLLEGSIFEPQALVVFFRQWLGMLEWRTTYTCFLSKIKIEIHGFLTRGTRERFSTSRNATYLMSRHVPYSCSIDSEFLQLKDGTLNGCIILEDSFYYFAWSSNYCSNPLIIFPVCQSLLSINDYPFSSKRSSNIHPLSELFYPSFSQSCGPHCTSFSLFLL